MFLDDDFFVASFSRVFSSLVHGNFDRNKEKSEKKSEKGKMDFLLVAHFLHTFLNKKITFEQTRENGP
jgi:hypothetical protein